LEIGRVWFASEVVNTVKVLLINPPLASYTKKNLGTIIENLFYNSPPLGLCYLASVLEKENHRVKIIDAPVLNLSFSKILERVRRFSPDLIGITSFTVSFHSCYKLAQEIKRDFPYIKIVVGGPHITSNPEELLKHPEFDIGVLGEGELTTSELVNALEEKRELRDIRGLVYVEDGKLIFTGRREYISNLDILPFPARDLVPIELYRPQPNDQKRLPKLSMVTSRGCPYGCIFCDKNIFKNIYRSFSPKYIVNEIRHLMKEYKARDIAFVDSTFTPNRERVLAIVEEMEKANLDFTWTCSVRANVLTRDLLVRMKKVGCWRIRIGVESGNEEVLKFIRKGITKSQVRKVANWAYELDLEPKGFFMIGHLNDNRKTIEETIDFACSLPFKDVTVQINTPLKNTPQYNLITKYGRLVTNNYSNYSFWEPVFIPVNLTYKELISYYRKFYLKFYLRPIIWYRHIIKIRRLSDITKYLRGIKILIYFLNLCWKRRF
jgi:radical SAM superfamily enzyme YgiQ (UPF0313 family)